MLIVGGREYRVACRDGEEPELTAAAELLDRRAGLVADVGGLNEARTLLMAGLLLADELMNMRQDTAPVETGLDPQLEDRIVRLAERAERLADILERPAS